MNKGVIISYSIKYIIVFIICIALLFLIIRKGRAFYVSTLQYASWKDNVTPLEMLLCFSIILITSVGFFATISLSVPLIKDMPYIFNDEYLSAEGYVSDNAMGGAAGRVQQREFSIVEEKTDKKLHFITLSTGIKEGEYVRVTYLPNSGLATINSRQQSELEDNKGE